MGCIVWFQDYFDGGVICGDRLYRSWELIHLRNHVEINDSGLCFFGFVASMKEEGQLNFSKYSLINNITVTQPIF